MVSVPSQTFVEEFLMSERNIKILVVDDFELARQMLKNILTGMGFQNVEEADDGKTAYSKIKSAIDAKQPFQLVLSDWHMPIVSGYEFLKLIRSNDQSKTVPFIMVSAECETEAIVSALQAGANDFICKPINEDVITKKIGRVLNKQKAS